MDQWDNSAALVAEKSHSMTNPHHCQSKHQSALKTWPHIGYKRKESIEVNLEELFNRSSEWTLYNTQSKNREKLKPWVPKEGEITEGPVTRLFISRSPADSSSDWSSHQTGSGIEQKNKEGTVTIVNQGSAHSSTDDASLYTGFEEEHKSKEGTEPRVIISQSPTDSSSDGASHHTDFEKEQKSSEWTVTRVIISRSPAASSTDRASHHTEFEEEHKCKAATMMTQQIQRPMNTRSEDLITSRRYGYFEQGNKDNSDVKTKPRSTQSEDLKKSRRFGYAEAAIEERRPSPVLPNSECLQAHKRYGYVEKDPIDEPTILFAEESKAQTKFHSMADNAEDCFDDSLQRLSSMEQLSREEGNHSKHQKSKTIAVIERVSERESNSSVQYIYYKAKHFQHFHYIYNLTRDCHDRIERLRKTNDRANFMTEDIVIKIGIVGKSTEDKLCSLLKRRGIKEMPSQNQQIWKQSPILCFQESTKPALEVLRREKACHKILIISDPNHKETKKIEDSIFIIREDKEDILRMISICLEEQIHNTLQDWLSDLSEEDFGKHLPWIIDEIKDIRKEMFDENIYHTTGSVNESIVPSNVIKYLFGRPDVNSFGIWRNSSFKVFVRKTIDRKELEHALKNLHQLFFEKYNLEIIKGRLVALESLKQGDFLLRKEGGKCFSGTLGGFVTKRDDERKIYALTCNHVFPQENLLAYTENPDKDIGTCVFTKKDISCDFATIEIKESFSSQCNVALRREDNKEINAKVYNESLETINFVHKIGATTNTTKGRILSPEYYNKALPQNTFLVKGTDKNFSEPGDSGSLVFSRPRTGRQNFINVFGMVFADNFELREDDNDSDNDQHLERNKDSEGTQNRDAEKVEANVDKTTSSNAPTSSVGDDDKNTEILSCCYRIHPAFDLFKEERGVEVKFKDDLPTPTSSPDDSYEENN